MGALDAVPPLVLDALLKGSVWIALVATLARLLRNHSAAARNAVWTAALLGQLALPMLSLALPSWHVPILPRVEQSVSAALVGMMSGREDGFASHLATSSHSLAGESLVVVMLPWAGFILTVLWLAGLIGVLARLWIGNMAVRRLVRQARRVDDRQWLSLTSEITAMMQVRRPITLLYGEQRAIPMTWGIVRPTILLPRDAAGWPAERRRLVLLHEMAHVRRFDALTQLVGQLALALCWMNPLVWIAARRMAAERERACDDYVLRDGTVASAYARELLEMVQTLGAEPGPAAAALALGRPSDFECRMLAILNPGLNRRSFDRRGAAATGIMAGLIIVLLAVLRPVAREETASEQRSISLPPSAQFLARAAEPAGLLAQAPKPSEGSASWRSRHPGEPVVTRDAVVARIGCKRSDIDDWTRIHLDTSPTAASGPGVSNGASGAGPCDSVPKSLESRAIADASGGTSATDESTKALTSQPIGIDSAKLLTIVVPAALKDLVPNGRHNLLLMTFITSTGEKRVRWVRLMAFNEQRREAAHPADSVAESLDRLLRQLNERSADAAHTSS